MRRYLQLPSFLTTLTILLGLTPFGVAALTFEELVTQTHLHGFAVDQTSPDRLYLATHDGLFVIEADGSVEQISKISDDFMGFAPHPTDPSILYASGHPASGGNLGVITSADGGQNWTQLAKGVNGPVDFHQMDVSKADPNVLYGVGAHGASLQVSRDGGQTWEMIGPAPEGLFDLAASAESAERLYAATQNGLLLSEDGGKSWQDGYWLRRPTSMVHVTPAGDAYAFVFGTGLIRTTEPALTWRTVSKDWGDVYLMYLAVDPNDRDRLYVVTSDKRILRSEDGGKRWASLGG